MSDEVIKLQIINGALTGVGDKPQSALSSGSDNATVAETVYEDVVEAALTSGPEWPFGTKTVAPTHIGARADKIFTDEWSLPPDNLEVKAVLLALGGGKPFPITDYEIEESKLLVNHSSGIFVRHIYRSGETLWHPNFRTGVRYMLIGAFQRAFWEDERAAAASESTAAIWFGRAAQSAGHKRKVESRSIRRRRYGRP